MKRTVKRILAVLLTAVMLLSVAPMNVFAKGNVTDGTAEGVMSDVNLKATNSVGELVTKALEKNGLDAESEYGVTGLDFDGKTATVTGFAKENCALIVAIYDENSNRMLASGIGEFSEDEQTASVEISTTQMPEYFVAYAFLLDENGSALCDKFTSREHTHDFEEFYEKTVDDFDKDKVINLDENKESNFVVLTEGAETVDAQNGKNKLVSVDDEKGIYVFENIDSDISSLKAGDIFRYEQKNEQDVLVIKVKSVSINGSTATVTSDDTDLTEVFDYVKIEGNTTGENTTVDMSEADEGVEYRRIEEETGEIQTSSFGYNDSKSISSEFTIKEKEIKKNVKLSAKLTFKISASVNVYYQRKAFADDYLDMSIKIEPSVTLSFSLTGKAEKSFVKLGEIGIYVCPGVYIGFTPQFVVEVSGSISISGTIKGCIGYSYNSDEGFKNTSSPFDFKPKVEISVEVFIGINLKPHIAIIHEKIADASISGEIGFKIKASTDLSESATSKAKHDCKVCIDGDISFVIKFSAELKLFNSEKWKYGADLWNTSFKIADFYISVPYGFGWGVCPHKFYEVKFTVADLDYEKAYKISSVGAGILSGIITGSISTGLKAYELVNDNFFKSNSSALISKGNVKGNGNSRYYLHGSDTWDGNIATVTDGVATLYYTNGDQTATISAPGYKSKDISFTINDSGKSLVVFLEKDSGSDNPGGETGGSTSDGTGSNDSVFTGTEATGTIINFGSYPQSKVTDGATISALDSVEKSWKSYNYYSGTGSWSNGKMTSSDYMLYADFLYGGEKYRAVTFSEYRPYHTIDTSSASNSNQDGNGYFTDSVYYFKYEPLKWRVLDSSTGLVVCDSIIDSQPYNNYILYSGSECWGDSSQTYYASNWEYSSLRKWLNEDFYNTAFSKTQQDRIKELTRENKSEYDSKYDSNPTSEKITLLSYDEVLNKNYGFSPLYTNDTARQCKGTDYAKCQGLWVSSSYGGTSWWRLRSPYYSFSAKDVDGDGWANGGGCDVNSTEGGIVPALNLTQSKIGTSSITSGEIAAEELTDENAPRTSQAAQTVYAPLANGEFTLGSAIDGNRYMVYGVTDYSDSFTLTSDNLVYIDQSEGKDGKVTLTYKPSRTESATVIVVGDFGNGIEAKRVEFKTGYTVTWNIDGKTVTEIYAAGDKLTPATVPAKSGYTFKGWDKSVPSTMPANDLTFTAVYEKNVEKKNVKSVSIDDISLNYKKSTTLKPTIKADDGAKYKVEYSTSNAKVATVDKNGKVTATKRGSGTATITCTVTDSNGNVVKDTCKVSVKLSFGQILIVYVLFGWIWY